MITLLAALTLMTSSVEHTDSVPDSIHVERLARSERVDTLREVEVFGRQRLAVMDALEATLRAQGRQPSTPSLGDVLNKYAPNAQDYILHPFGFKERKKKRQRKRMQDILNEYEQAKTFEELLDEAVKRQQEEDAKGGK